MLTKTFLKALIVGRLGFTIPAGSYNLTEADLALDERV